MVDARLQNDAEVAAKERRADAIVGLPVSMLTRRFIEPPERRTHGNLNWPAVSIAATTTVAASDALFSS
jgi:hypothetical protein